MPHQSTATLLLALALAVATAVTRQNPTPPDTSVESDPANPYHWATQAENDQTNSAPLWNQALTLAPNIPQIWLRHANDRFFHNDTQTALQSAARVLATVPDYDSTLFNTFRRLAIPTPQILAAIGTNRRATQAFAKTLWERNEPTDAQLLWNHLTTHNFTDDSLAISYLNALLRQHLPDTAARDWAAYLGPKRRPPDYPTPNAIFNASFESDPTGAPLDWRITPHPAADTARDPSTSFSGQASLRIRFNGSENLSYAHLSQAVPVRPGPYRFTAHIRTHNLTTNEGLRLELTDAHNPSRFSYRSDSFSGTHPWTPIALNLLIPNTTRLLNIRLIRHPSTKFDNKISGTAWLDALSLKPQSPT